MRERIAGRVPDAAYVTRADYLARLEAGEEVTAPVLDPTPDQHFHAQLAEAFAPGQPHEYQLPRDPMKPLEGNALELDAETREFLTELGVPVRLGGPIVERVELAIRTLAPLSPDEREAKVESVRATLRSAWGDQFKPRMDAIADYLTKATSKHERIGEMLDAMPWVVMDVAVMEWLHSLVEFRGRGRRS